MTREEIRNGIIKSLNESIETTARLAEVDYEIIEDACRKCKVFKVEPFIDFVNGYCNLYAKIELDDTLKNSTYYKNWLNRDIMADKTMLLQKCFMDAPELNPLKLSKDLWGIQWEMRKDGIYIPLSKMGLV